LTRGGSAGEWTERGDERALKLGALIQGQGSGVRGGVGRKEEEEGSMKEGGNVMREGGVTYDTWPKTVFDNSPRAVVKVFDYSPRESFTTAQGSLLRDFAASRA
jgi:hypothetical protein